MPTFKKKEKRLGWVRKEKIWAIRLMCNEDSVKEENTTRKPNKYEMKEFKTRSKGINNNIDIVSTNWMCSSKIYVEIQTPKGTLGVNYVIRMEPHEWY